MNDTLIIPSDIPTGNPLLRLDCSDIKIQLCNQLTNNMDSAVILIGICLAAQMLRKPLMWLAMKNNIFIVPANALNESKLPELLIFICFIFLAYVRFFA